MKKRARLSRSTRRRVGGHPAKVLLDLAVTLTLGGDCLADVAVLRSEPGVYGRVASGPTVSRTIDAGEERQPWRQLGERPCFQK